MARETKTIPEEIKNYLSYNPETGELTWIKKPCHRICVGKKAGSENLGYIRIGFKGKNYAAHRIAYYLFHKEIDDTKDIDHINGDGTDNRIENLRLVSHQKNMWNAPNARGACRFRKKWRAFITIDSESKYLGLFDTENEAREAYLQAKRAYHAEACSHY